MESSRTDFSLQPWSDLVCLIWSGRMYLQHRFIFLWQATGRGVSSRRTDIGLLLVDIDSGSLQVLTAAIHKSTRPISVAGAIGNSILYPNRDFTSDRDLGCCGGRPFALLLGFPVFSSCTLHAKVRAPGTFLSVHSTHCCLSLIFAAEVDEEVVVVTGFESLRGVWGKQLADAFTIMPKRICVRKKKKKDE